MGETQKEFVLEGKINFQITLKDDGFSYRSQVSNENNLVHFIAIRELTQSLIQKQKNPALPKSEKWDKKKMEMVMNTHKICSMYSEQLAAAIFEIYEKKDIQPDAPKIEIVPAMKNIKS